MRWKVGVTATACEEKCFKFAKVLLLVFSETFKFEIRRDSKWQNWSGKQSRKWPCHIFQRSLRFPGKYLLKSFNKARSYRIWARIHTEYTQKRIFFNCSNTHLLKICSTILLNLYSWDKKVQSANTKKLIAAPAICYFIFMLITFLSYLLKLQCHSIFNFYESN